MLTAPAPPPAATDAAPPAAAYPRELLDGLMTARGPALRLYARACLAGRPGAAAAADDAVQTAFLRLARRLARDPQFAKDGGPPDPAGWLFRTVRNLARDHRRTAARRLRRERAAAKPDWFRPAPPGAELDADLDADAVAAALAGLPADLREPVVLHVWGGRTFAEVGSLLGCSASAAHRRYGRGLDLLRRSLGDDR